MMRDDWETVIYMLIVLAVSLFIIQLIRNY